MGSIKKAVRGRKGLVEPTKLSAIDLTNGEFARLGEVVDFLEFMRSERVPVPNDGIELETLLTRYVIHWRGEQMQRLCDEGKITPAAVARLRRRYA